jgi:hypothetical protein
MDPNHKLHVKLGDAEFIAEGSEASVKEQFERFLEAYKVVRPPSRETTAENGLLPEVASIAVDSSGIDHRVLGRVFALSKDGLVSLRVLPRGEGREANTVLLLLYGYQVLREQHDVLGSRLLQSARQSGMPMDRVDRSLAPHINLVTKAGARRGTRYGLNNRGRSEAEGLVQRILE